MFTIASYAGPAPGDIAYSFYILKSIPWHGHIGCAFIFAHIIAYFIVIKKYKSDLSKLEIIRRFKALLWLNLAWSLFLFIENLGYATIRSFQSNSSLDMKIVYIGGHLAEVFAPLSVGLLISAIWLYLFFQLKFKE